MPEPTDTDYEILASEIKHICAGNPNTARCNNTVYIKGMGTDSALRLFHGLSVFLSRLDEDTVRGILAYQRHKKGLE